MVAADVMMPQLRQNLDAANPQHHFLAKAIVEVSAVEVIRQSLIPGSVLSECRVQQIHRHDVTRDTFYRISSGSYPHLTAGHRDKGDRLHRLQLVPGDQLRDLQAGFFVRLNVAENIPSDGVARRPPSGPQVDHGTYGVTGQDPEST